MRSAWMPRSCSPMGPDPTRVPLIALPPDATNNPLLDIETCKQAKDNDAGHPDQRDNHRDAVQVSLRNT